MKTLWDNYFDQEHLEAWLYGTSSLKGKTREWLVNRIKRNLNVKTFIDLGCGGGVTAYQFNTCGLLDRLAYTGVDFSECMLTLAKRKVKHKNVTWEKSALEEYVSCKKYDVVLLRAVIDHVFDPAPVLQSACNLVSPKGCLYIIFWNNPVESDPVIKKVDGGFYDISHNKDQLKNMLSRCGVEISEELEIEEKSEHSNTRLIWVVKKPS